MIIKGAYGPYVKGPGRFNNVKIPSDQDPAKITLEEAKKMLEEKPKGRGRFARRKGTTGTKATKGTKSTKARSKSTKTAKKKTTKKSK